MRTQLIGVAVICLSWSAQAGVTQPDGTPIPTSMGCSNNAPTGLAAIFACQCTSGGCNIGAPCPGNQDPNTCDNGQHGTCETTIWHAWNDDACIPSHVSGLSPVTNASTTPETFQPTCALTFTELRRGTAEFHDVFGWYNVTGSKPDVSDLHVMLDCNAPPNTQVVLDLVGAPGYLGGEVGFFIATPEGHAPHGSCAGGDCCASLARLVDAGYVYYSQREFNPDATQGNSYVHLLTYDSQLTPHKFYFAWEDLYAGGGNNDFTDLVTSVDGVECAGGGQSCDTGQMGLCAQGVSVCQNGMLGCTALYAPQPEICDGVDQDCDGQIDEGATCPDGEVCDRGQCTPKCDPSAEFACGDTLACDSTRDVCVDLTCTGVTCPDGQVCDLGTCHAPCDGIVCPHGSECFMGACVDRCDHVGCAAGQVCVEGTCFAGCDSCDGIQCANSMVCASGGQCSDPSCPNGCPTGTYCSSGQCLDDCNGAVCPTGQVCTDGHCKAPGDGDTGDGPRPTGCMCTTGGALPFESWPIGVALVLAARRRRRVRI